MPPSLVAGDTLSLEVTVPGIVPADGEIALFLNGPTALASAASWVTELAASWRITVPAQATAGLPAGTYRWALRTTVEGVTRVVAQGQLAIAANPATLPPGSHASWEAEALQIVRARLRGDLSGGVMDYMLYGRTVRRYPLAELMRIERRLAIRVAHQSGRPLRVQRLSTGFRRPG